jgi:hypothetical protein
MTPPRPTTGVDPRGDRRLRSTLDAGAESGMMLTELLVASVLLVVLGTLVLVTLSSYLRVSNEVQASYTNTQQDILVGANFQKLVRADVEPAPTPTTGTNANVPVPAFSTAAGSDTGQYVGSTAVGTFSTTFYANVGASAGPAQIVASETANTVVAGKPKTWTFSVTEQLPDSGTCPFSVTSTSLCTYKDLSNNPPKEVFELPDIVNNDTPTTVYAGTSQATSLTYTPIFTYILLQTSSTTSGQEVPVSMVTPAPTGFSWPLPETAEDDSIFHACAATPSGTPAANTCPGAAVQGVTINLLIQSSGSATAAQDETTVFALTPTSSLYNPLVG